MTRTIEEIAIELDVDEDAARHLVKFLQAVDPPLARDKGERPPENGIGHGPKVYEIDEEAPAEMLDLLARLV
jgi:hypothetical protein